MERAALWQFEGSHTTNASSANLNEGLLQDLDFSRSAEDRKKIDAEVTLQLQGNLFIKRKRGKSGNLRAVERCQKGQVRYNVNLMIKKNEFHNDDSSC